jgi:hypothetical protein
MRSRCTYDNMCRYSRPSRLIAGFDYQELHAADLLIDQRHNETCLPRNHDASSSACAKLGFSQPKTATLLGLAQLLSEDESYLDRLAELDDDATRAGFLAKKGIGRWSAEYILLVWRVLMNKGCLSLIAEIPGSQAIVRKFFPQGSCPMNESVEVFERKLTHADDRIRLSRWIPQQWGVIPRIRFAKRWFNVLWLLPLSLLVLIISLPWRRRSGKFRP